MSDFLAIDYGKLPIPELVKELDEEVIKEQILAAFKKGFPQYTADLESDLGRALIEVATYLQMSNIAQLNYNGQQNFATLAKGSNLDHEAANWGLTRQYEVIKDKNGIEQKIYEDDETLRRRRLLAPEALTTAGSRAAYLYHIYTASKEVRKIELESFESGVVLKHYLAKNGFAQKIKHAEVITPAPGIVHFSFIVKDLQSKPDQELIQAVVDNLNAGDVRPMTDKVEYKEPEKIEYTLNIIIYLKDGAVEDILRPPIEKNLEEYIEEARRLGSIVDLGAIYAACHIGDVADVDVIDFEDIECRWNEYPVCVGIEIQFIAPQHNRPAWQENWRG